MQVGKPPYTIVTSSTGSGILDVAATEMSSGTHSCSEGYQGNADAAADSVIANAQTAPGQEPTPRKKFCYLNSRLIGQHQQPQSSLARETVKSQLSKYLLDMAHMGVCDECDAVQF